MAMPVNMILVMYVILCILSYNFNKLTMLYIHVHISVPMTNKSELTFFLSIKYLSVCLSVCVLLYIIFGFKKYLTFNRLICYSSYSSIIMLVYIFGFYASQSVFFATIYS